MGYTTDFTGGFAVSPPLQPEHIEYLKKFSDTRRMKRNKDVIDMPDAVRKAVDLPAGPEGAYFVGGGGWAGQDRDKSVAEYNSPPTGQPSLWCHWVPTEDGNAIEWDMGEKFYSYVEWIEYLIEHFLEPWGYTLEGQVYWYGEDRDDNGIIDILNNEVTAREGRIVYE